VPIEVETPDFDRLKRTPGSRRMLRWKRKPMSDHGSTAAGAGFSISGTPGLRERRTIQYPLLVTLAFCMLTGPILAGAQTSPVESESKATPLAENGRPIDRLIARVAKKTGKKFVVDPRVRANVIVAGEEPSEISYPQFLTVLEVYGFIAMKTITARYQR
jgi:hypothetical protein